MSFVHFIARRILRPEEADKRSLSRPIVVIAVLGIVVGMAVMILTVGITRGFQREVRAKVTGAGGHLQITALWQSDPKETPRIPIDQSFYPWLDTVPGVAHIQIYATKPGIIETDQEIQGVVVKGVGTDHDWTFMQEHLVSGRVPVIGDPDRSIDLLLSRYLADRLRIQVDDTITVYLIKGRDDIRPRKFHVSGIYETGIEQIDHQLVLIDIGHLQRFSQWGLKSEIRVGELEQGRFVEIEGLAFGGDRKYTLEWPGRELEGRGPHRIDLWGERRSHAPNGTPGSMIDTARITLVVHDEDRTIPDTAWVQFIPMAQDAQNTPLTAEGLKVVRGGSGGSHTKYVGGFEVTLDRYEDLMRLDDLVYEKYLPTELRSTSVRDRFPELFTWLQLLDKNVVVVIILMIIVSIINMTSALLILILERTTMIGILKALGSSNGAIRRIFLVDAAYILGVGILLGDLLGIGLAWVQQRFGLVKLPVETYYVDRVVVDLDLWPILLLNAGTLLVCVAALVLPSMLVSRIAPAKAIRCE
ncbi:MAG TPA: ABC transporter permease [Flavobacteriales bacterium]|nr:ABC transporter permease [Flavobacteriales bacterium]